jgi:hypothetical protein
MNGLYPIIRRVRRPLLPPETPADTKALAGGHQAAQAVATVEPPPAVPPVAPVKTQPKRKDKRGKAAASEPAK